MKVRVHFRGSVGLMFLFCALLGEVGSPLLAADDSRPATTQSSPRTSLYELDPNVLTDPTTDKGWTPLRVSIWKDTVFPRTRNVSGISFGGWDMAGHMNGIQLGVFGTESERLHGITIGLIGSVADGWGISIGGLIGTLSNKKFSGVQIGGVGNNWYFGSDSKNSGIQIGGLENFAAIENGIQVAVVQNAAAQLKGLQLGSWNVSEDTKGGQIGFWNSTGDLRGFQIGLYNECTTLKGFQLGIVNRARKPGRIPYEFVPVLNFSW